MEADLRRSKIAAAKIESLEQRAYFAIAFSAPIHFTADQNAAGILQAPAVGDFNEDGLRDLILAYATNADGLDQTPGSIEVALGNGAGTFTRQGPVAVGVFTGAPVVGDFNGDGNLDVVMANANGDAVLVVPGNGNGTFGTAQSFAAGSGPLAVVVGQFNSDTLDDVAVGNRNSDTVSVLLGNGSSLLGSATNINVGTDPASIQLGDFNNDNELDLAVGNAGLPTDTSGTITVLPGNGNGTFGSAVTTTGPRGTTGVGDFNNDDNLDLVVAIAPASGNFEPNDILGNGSGAFTGFNGNSEGFPVLVADFDQDGNDDVITATGVGASGGGPVQVSAGLGTGAFAATAPVTVADQIGAGVVGDFNNDGLPDLAYSTVRNGNRSISVVLSRVPGSDLTGQITGTLPTAVVGGAKGKADLLVTNNGNDPVKQSGVSYSLYASTDGTFDGSDTLITTLTKNLNLKAGKSKKFKFKFNYPSSLPDNNYSLLAIVDSGNGVPESNEGNNTAASGTQVTIAAPFVDFSGTLISPLPAAFVPGSKTKLKVEVTNTGNVPGPKGSILLSAFASTDTTLDGADTALGEKSTNSTIKPGKTKKVTISFEFPTVVPGSYFSLIDIDSLDAVTEPNEGNNVVASASAVPVS